MLSVPPAGSLDRIVAAYRRAVVKLPDSFASVNAELLRPDNELALAVVLGIWSGLDLPALGWLAGPIAESKGAAGLGTAGTAVERSVRQASSASDDRQLQQAADGIASAIGEVGPQRIAAMLSGTDFAQLRQALASMRQQLLAGSLWPSASTAIPAAPSAARQAASPSYRPLAWMLAGMAAGLGVLFVAVAHAPRRGK